MIDINETVKALYKSDSPRIRYKISLYRTTGTLLPANNLYPSNTLFPLAGGEAAIVIDGDRIISESVSIKNSICDSGNLIYGKCNSAMLTFQCADVTELYAGDELIVTQIIEENEIPFGAYTISSVKKTADRRFRTITAYDRMTRFDVNVADWFNGLFSGSATETTVELLRHSLLTYIGVPYETTTLIHDNLLFGKTIQPSEMSGREMLEAICEINGVFGYIDNYGQLRYKSLDTSTAVETIAIEQRKSLDYEDYTVKPISQVVIRQESNDVGASVGDGNNTYIIQGNFIVFGKSAAQLTAIATTIYNKIKTVTYVPLQLECRGLPYLEVGDCVDVMLKNGTSKRTVIMSNALSGIQALNSSIASYGNEKREETYGVSKSIIQLQGKANILERDVEGTTSRVSDLESGFTETSQKWDNLSFSVNSPTGEKYATLTLKTSADGQGEISLASANITIDGAVTFSNLATAGQTTINGGNITTGVISSQNYQSGVSGMSINLNNGTIWAPNFNLSPSGNLSCSDAYISGTIMANNGYIGLISAPWFIGSESTRAYIFNGKSSFNSDSSEGIYIGIDGIAFGKDKYYGGYGTVKITRYGSCSMDSLNTSDGVYFGSLSDYIRLDSNNRLQIQGYNGVFVNNRRPVATMSAYPNVKVGLDVNVGLKRLYVYYDDGISGESLVGYAQLT